MEGWGEVRAGCVGGVVALKVICRKEENVPSSSDPSPSPPLHLFLLVTQAPARTWG